MKLNMKVLSATVLTVATLGLSNGAYAFFDFGVFAAALPATTSAADPAITNTIATLTAVDTASDTAATANIAAVAAVQTAVVTQQQQANVNISAL